LDRKSFGIWEGREKEREGQLGRNSISGRRKQGDGTEGARNNRIREQTMGYMYSNS
jgi:hypothetical protein